MEQMLAAASNGVSSTRCSVGSGSVGVLVGGVFFLVILSLVSEIREQRSEISSKPGRLTNEY
jgi:CHASE3 domain sensor protein